MSLARSALSALADSIRSGAELTNDVKTAMSEACNNVVLHAYPAGATGPLIVSLAANGRGLEVIVEDRGDGIRHVSMSEDHAGVGLAVMTALATRMEIQSEVGEGTAVRMSFAAPAERRRPPHAGPLYPGAHEELEAARPPLDPALTPTLALGGAVVAWIAPREIVGEVLGRLLRALAASAYYTFDGVAGLFAIGNAIGEVTMESAAAEATGFAVTTHRRRIELTAGPYAQLDGSGPRVSSAWRELGQLTDELSVVDCADGRQLLRLVTVDPHRAAQA